MATLLLAGLAASATAGAGAATVAIVGGLAVAAGSYIDSTYLIPAIMGKPEAARPQIIEGPRVQDLQFQHANEGGPVGYVLGEEARVPGTVVWLSGLIERANVSARATRPWGISTSFTYSVDLAIAVCEGEIEDIEQIWADGRPIVQTREPHSVTGEFLQVQAIDVFSNIASFDGSLAYTGSRIRGFPGAPSFDGFITGAQIKMSGWTNAGNNDTFRVVQIGEETAGGITFMDVVPLEFVEGARMFPEAVGATVTIEQIDVKFTTEEIADVRVFTGELDQDPDPLIQEAEGIDNVPGFRKIAYVVLEGLEMSQFGNRLPQFQFLVKEKTNKKVKDAISDVFLRAGLTTDQFDVSEIDDADILGGFATGGPQAMMNILMPIMVAFDLMAIEEAGKIKVKPRSSRDVITIADGDLAAHEEGGESPRLFTQTDTQERDLPNEVTVRFIEPKQNYQPSLQRERRLSTPSDSVMALEIPLTMTATQARKIARRQLWLTWSGRSVFSIDLPPKYLAIQENDQVEFTFKGEKKILLTKRVDIGANLAIRVEGNEEFEPAATQVGVEEAGDDLRGFSIFVSGALVFEIIDIAPLFSSHQDTPGMYYGIALFDFNADFTSADVLQAGDGQNFSVIDTQSSEAIVGYNDGARFPDGVPGLWDRSSTVTIQLLNGELSDATELEVMNGVRNWCIMGGEVVGFANATLVGENRYVLDTFLRALRNTEDHVANHDIDRERFVTLCNAIKFTRSRLSSSGNR